MAADRTTPRRRRGDIGLQRARIAPTLTGEQLAEMFGLAEFGIGAGGSLCFGKPSPLGASLIALRLVERVPQPDLGRGSALHRLTKLGWFTLLTRAETEMAHLLPLKEECDDAA